MSDTSTGTRDTALLSVACAAGTVVSPQLPYVGLPIAAAAAAGLAFRSRTIVGVLAALLGVGVAALLYPQSAAFTIPAVVGIMLAVVLLPTRSEQVVGAITTLVFAAAAVAADALSAHSAGMGLLEAVRKEAQAATVQLEQILGSGASGLSEQIDTVRDVVVTLWPSFYVQSALVAAVLVIAAVAWAARRSGVPVKVARMRELDLSVHVLWALVGGLVMLAASAYLGAYAQVTRAIALNLLFVARFLFFLQGVAVFSAVFDVPRTGYGKMVGLYVALWLLDQFLLIASLAGMLDFWANFRRLPRDGANATPLLEDPPSSI